MSDRFITLLKPVAPPVASATCSEKGFVFQATLLEPSLPRQNRREDRGGAGRHVEFHVVTA